MEPVNFTSLSNTERDELLGLAPSTWKENSPYWHRDYRRTECQTSVGLMLENSAFGGVNDEDIERYENIMGTIQSDDDRKALAEYIVTWENYSEFEPLWFELGQDEHKEKILNWMREKYNSLDAYVEAAQLEFTCNIQADYADIDDLLKIFGKYSERDLMDNLSMAYDDWVEEESEDDKFRVITELLESVSMTGNECEQEYLDVKQSFNDILSGKCVKDKALDELAEDFRYWVF